LQVIISGDGKHAEFVHECCTRDATGGVVCSHDDDDKWITILYFAITSLKVRLLID
jgi:hypothetical protein